MRRQKIEGGMDVKGSGEGRGKDRKAVAWLKAKGDCGRKDCVIHTKGGKGWGVGGGGGGCNRENVVYEGCCSTCKDKGNDSVYIGESSRSGYVRGRQHLETIRDHRRNQYNAYAKHIREEHEGREAKFRLDIINDHRTHLERQIR